MSSEELSHAYMEAHPADAARVLERLAAGEAGAMLQSVPQRIASPVLRQMLPQSGAQSGVALLRYFVAERRTRVLAHLPTAMTIA